MLILKKILILILLTCISLLATNRDSLIQKLNTNREIIKETVLLDMYFDIGSSFNNDKEFNKALEYLRQGLGEAYTDIDKARFYHKIGQVFVDSTNYNLGLENLNFALELYSKENELEKLSTVHNLIGMCYGLTNNLDMAIESFKQSLEVNKQIKDSSAIGQSFFNIGLANYFQGKYDKATEYYIESLKIREQLPDTNSLVSSLTTLGETLRIRKKYDDAMNYYSRALALKKGIRSKESLAYIYSEIGLVYKYQKRFVPALAYLDTSLQISIEGKYKRGIATLYTYKAGIEKELGNYNTALDLYLKSIDRYNDIGFEVGISQSQIAIAGIYKERKNYRRAKKLLNSAKQKAEANHLLEEQTDIARLNYEIGKAQNNPHALGLFEKYIVLKDSLFNIEKEKQISEIETKYETEKKEKQIAVLDHETKLQQQQIALQKYLIAGVIAFAFIIATFALLFIRQNKLKSEIKVEQGRFRLLRSQMNPHFIYNALTAIQSVVLKNNPMESASFISGFSKLMRQVLEHSRQDFISLKEETEFLENYLKLQQLRFSNKFDFKIDFDPALLEADLNIPPMLTQPVVENAVEHGMRALENGNGVINVEYALDENKLLICISDNGLGINTANDKKDKQHKSLATEITHERLTNIKKLQKLNIEVEVSQLTPDKANKGTNVKFIIPQEMK